MLAQHPNTNFVRRTVYTQTDTSEWDRQETVLFDGMGRSVHSVRLQASPDGGDVDMTGSAGNVRLVTDASGTPLQVNHYDPVGSSSCPFRLRHGQPIQVW